MIESYQAPKGVDLAIETWEATFDLEASTTEWNDEVWNARASNCNHESYRITINAIKDVADQFGIASDIDGCQITPMHFLFAKYMNNDEMIPKMIDKIKKINPGTTNLREVCRLREETYNPRQIQEDSFRDGGFLLLWCLKNGRPKVLNALLGENLVQFWRFA